MIWICGVEVRKSALEGNLKLATMAIAQDG